MIERFKSAILVLLVVLSLLQSYWLAYSMPGFTQTVRTEMDYMNAEKMGPTQQIDNVIFPDSIILHLGQGAHTVLFPPTNFYDLVFRKIEAVGFKGFTRNPMISYDWDQISEKKQGVELRFGGGIPISLLSKMMKLEGDLLFLADRIERIWIYMDEDTELVHAFLFSEDGRTVYEAARTDLTAKDVQEYVGFGEYGTPYKQVGRVYAPVVSIEAVQAQVSYETYTPEQMRSSLFFDSGTTRTLENLNGALIYTDGKRGLQFEQNGKWISYTNPAAPQTTDNDTTENVLASVQFVNEHGGWNGLHRYVPVKLPANEPPSEFGRTVQFQQYYGSYPLLSNPLFKFGYMRLSLQQGLVTEYERSVITLNVIADSKTTRWLSGGDTLQKALERLDRRNEIVALFPAMQVKPKAGKNVLGLEPVWAVRYGDGTQQVVMTARPAGYDGAAERRDYQATQTKASGASGSDASKGSNEYSETSRTGKSATNNFDGVNVSVSSDTPIHTLSQATGHGTTVVDAEAEPQ